MTIALMGSVGLCSLRAKPFYDLPSKIPSGWKQTSEDQLLRHP